MTEGKQKVRPGILIPYIPLEKMFVVIHEPKRSYREGMHVVLYHVRATSKAAAVAEYRKRVEQGEDKYYKKPRATLVMDCVVELV